MFLLSTNTMAVMATGDPTVAKGHIPKLQSSTKLHKPGPEPEPSRPKKEGAYQESEHQTGLLLGGELEEAVGDCTLDWDHGCTLHMEVHPVQKHVCIQSHGLLPDHSQGSCRDSQVQHGAHPSPGLPEHDNVAPFDPSLPCAPLRR